MSLFNDDPNETAEDKMGQAFGCFAVAGIVAVLAVIVGAVILIQKVL